MSKKDTALLSRCQGADASAFDEIVLRYKQKIFQYILRMVGDSDEAEDLTQEVFVKTYLSLSAFRSQASLNTWIYRIAGNLCIDAHRKRTRRETAFGGSAISLDERPGPGFDSDEARTSWDVADERHEPFSLLAKQELDSQIQAALGRLPEKMRSVVILHDIEGFAYEEIAEIVDCPLGTVKSRLFNARVQMRDMLHDYIEA